MFNKQEIITSLDTLLDKIKNKLSQEEIKLFNDIKGKIKDAKTQNQLVKWAYEILRLINLGKDFFD